MLKAAEFCVRWQLWDESMVVQHWNLQQGWMVQGHAVHIGGMQCMQSAGVM